MVPKVAGKGRSFKGAGLYYLHDKKALTSERVAFTHTVGLATDDPDKAIRFMAHTAMNQNHIKARAGGKTQGRKLRDPVYTYSLSWAPDETPSQQEMIESAHTTLDELGLAGHESLFVAHNDEPHPHIHVIVNRVNPETGIAAKLSNDHLKLSSWAESYEKQQGQIRCEQRVENNERRRNGEFVKDRKSENKADFYQWRRLRLQQLFEKRQAEARDLNASQKVTRAALLEKRNELIQRSREKLRERSRKFWRATYQSQKRERDKLADRQATAWGRLKTYLVQRTRHADHGGKNPYPRGLLSGAFNAVMSRESALADLEAKQQQERKDLAAKITKLQRDEAARIDSVYAEHKELLKDRHKTERDALQDKHTQERLAEARRIAQEIDKLQYRMDKQREHNERIEAIIDALARSDSEYPDLKKIVEQVDRAREEARRSGLNGRASDDWTDVAEPPPKKTRMQQFNEAAKDFGKGALRRAFGRIIRRDGTDKKKPRTEEFNEAAKDKGKGSARRAYERAAKEKDAQPKNTRTEQFNEAAKDKGKGSARRAYERAVKGKETATKRRTADEFNEATKDTGKGGRRRTFNRVAKDTEKPKSKKRRDRKSKYRRFRDNAEDIGRERPRPGGGRPGPGRGGPKR